MNSINLITKTKQQIIICCLVLATFSSFSQISFSHTWHSGGQHILSRFIELKDSSFILAGSLAPNTTSNATGLLMRCNKSGDSLYTFNYDTSQFIGLQLVNDSEVVVTGGFFDWNKGVLSASKINFNNGDTLFCKYYLPGNLQVAPGPLYKCKDKGFIMLNYSYTNYDYVKIDSNYNIQWHKSCNMGEIAWQIKPDPLGGYVAVGTNGYSSTPYAVQRLDSAGNIIWSYGYGNVSFPNWSQYYIAADVVIADDSNYIVSCLENNISYMKINRLNGDTIWTKSNLTGSYIINNAGNDRYITITSKFTLMDGNGNFIWQTPIVPNGFNLNYANYCAKTLDGGYAFCGSINFQTMVFVKLDSTGHVINTSIYDIEKNKQVYFYPNPVSDVLNISGHTASSFTFSVYNFSGSKVIEVNNKSSVDVSALPAGFYVAEVREGGKVVREKFVKE